MTRERNEMAAWVIGFIRSHAESLTYHSGRLEIWAGKLDARPPGQTQAREELNSTEIALRQALAIVQAAQREYDTRPVIIEYQHAAE